MAYLQNWQGGERRHCSLTQKYSLTGRQQGFPDGTRGKESACQCRRHRRLGFNPWVGKIPQRRERQATPVLSPGKSYGQRSLGDTALGVAKKSDATDHTHSTHRQTAKTDSS